MLRLSCVVAAALTVGILLGSVSAGGKCQNKFNKKAVNLSTSLLTVKNCDKITTYLGDYFYDNCNNTMDQFGDELCDYAIKNWAQFVPAGQLLQLGLMVTQGTTCLKKCGADLMATAKKLIPPVKKQCKGPFGVVKKKLFKLIAKKKTRAQVIEQGYCEACAYLNVKFLKIVFKNLKCAVPCCEWACALQYLPKVSRFSDYDDKAVSCGTCIGAG